jgi:hypothetical protein
MLIALGAYSLTLPTAKDAASAATINRVCHTFHFALQKRLSKGNVILYQDSSFHQSLSYFDIFAEQLTLYSGPSVAG